MKKTVQFSKFSVFLTCAIALLATVSGYAQDVFPSPKFESASIQMAPGQPLAFTLNNLPDPKQFGDAKGNLEIQINWQLGNDCSNGTRFSERVKISATSHRFTTNYKVSKADDNKKLKLTVSYVQPTGNDESPAKGYIAASRDCASLKILKK